MLLSWMLMKRWSYLPKLTSEEAQAEMDEALKAASAPAIS